MFKSKTVTKDKDSHSIRRVNASWKWDSSQMHKGSTSGNIPRVKSEILWTDRHQYCNGTALPLRSIIINAEIKTENPNNTTPKMTVQTKTTHLTASKHTLFLSTRRTNCVQVPNKANTFKKV